MGCASGGGVAALDECLQRARFRRGRVVEWCQLAAVGALQSGKRQLFAAKIGSD